MLSILQLIDYFPRKLNKQGGRAEGVAAVNQNWK